MEEESGPLELESEEVVSPPVSELRMEPGSLDEQQVFESHLQPRLQYFKVCIIETFYLIC